MQTVPLEKSIFTSLSSPVWNHLIWSFLFFWSLVPESWFWDARKSLLRSRSCSQISQFAIGSSILHFKIMVQHIHEGRLLQHAFSCEFLHFRCYSNTLSMFLGWKRRCRRKWKRKRSCKQLQMFPQHECLLLPHKSCCIGVKQSIKNLNACDRKC